MLEPKPADFKSSHFSINNDIVSNNININKSSNDNTVVNTDKLSNTAITSTIDTSLTDIPCEIVKYPTLGAIRKDLGRSVEEVAGILRLSPKQINALELQHWAALPGAAYTKGFLKNYARYLKVDPQPYIAQFEAAIINEIPIATTETQNLEIQEGSVDLSKITTNTIKITHDNVELAPTYLIKLALGLVAATIVFLLIWENVLWQPKTNNTIANTSIKNTTNTNIAVLPNLSNVAKSNLNHDEDEVKLIKNTLPSTATTAPLIPGTEIHIAKNNTPSIEDNTATVPSSTSTLPTNKTVSLQDLQASADVLTALALKTKVSKDIKNTNQNITSDTGVGITRNLELIVDKSVWVEVRDAENKVLAYGVKPAGSKHQLIGNAPLKVVIGATNALRLNLDGKPYDFSGKVVGNVARFAIP